MTALHRKLLRDLWHLKGPAVAISLVMACGVATFVMSLSTLYSLERTKESYYERYRFAQVFTHVKRAPDALQARLEEIPGVARVQTRTVVDVTLDIPGMPEPAMGRLVSIPERRQPELNRLHLRRGRYIEPGRKGEVLASEAFTEAHRLQPGASVVAIINGRKERLTIVGVALSPEFIYPIREGDMLPDNRRFGVFWMGETELSAAFDLEGAFNNVCLSLSPFASLPEVLRRLDRLTASYGGLGAYDRQDQTSNRFIENEITQLRGMGLTAPLIFLVVASFLLNVVLSRLVSTQREQIATLKAFGYSNSEVGLHYLQFALVLAVCGTALGTAVGAWLGQDMTAIYSRFFRFPVFQYQLDAPVVWSAAGIIVFAAGFGALSAVSAAVRLQPAEAMRPEPPASFRPLLAERLGLLWLLSPTARMILRQLERRPLRPLLSWLGISLAIAIYILGSFVEDSIDYVIDFQFHATQRQDMTVTLVEPLSGRAFHELRELPGVLHAEPFRTLPARIRFGHRTRRLGITGLMPDRDLFQLIGTSGDKVSLPTEGLLVSAKLAELLQFRIGDFVTVEILEGSRPVLDLPVTGLITDFAGTSVYMELTALHRQMREGETISGAFLTVDPHEQGRFYARLKRTPQVSSVSIKQAALNSFRDTLAENLLRMRAFNVIFASIIAMGVVYNSALVSLAERSRELATLRVIGFTRREISLILLGELGLLVVAAIPAGLVIGHGFAYLAMLALDTESHRFPLIINPPTYGTAVAVIMMATLISGGIVRRRLDELDLVAVLKTRE